MAFNQDNYSRANDAIAAINRQAGNDNKFRRAIASWGAWGWLVALGAALAVGLPLTAIRTISQPRTYAPQEATKATAAQTQVAALGRIEPEGGVTDVGIPLGSIVAELLVEEGSTVERGDIIAYLNGYREELANWDLIESQIAEAKQQLQTDTQSEQARITAAATRLNTTNAPQNSTVAAQAASVRRIEVEYDRAAADLERFLALYNQGAISQQDLDQRQGEVLQLQEQINQARATLSQLQSTRTQELAEAAADLQVAQADLQRTRGQNQLASLQRSLDVAEAQLESTLVRAPQTGQVLRILTSSGESAIDSGQGGGTLLKMGNTREMYVVAEVYESDASLVKPGQPVTVISRNRAFQDEIKGTVTSVGNEIFKNNILDDDPAALNDARVVEVKIRLENSEAVASFTNLQVDVRIDVEPAAGSSGIESSDNEFSSNEFSSDEFSGDGFSSNAFARDRETNAVQDSE